MTKIRWVPKPSSYAAFTNGWFRFPASICKGTDIFVRGPGMSDDSNIGRSHTIFFATSIYSDSSISIADEDDDWNSAHSAGPSVGSFGRVEEGDTSFVCSEKFWADGSITVVIRAVRWHSSPNSSGIKSADSINFSGFVSSTAVRIRLMRADSRLPHSVRMKSSGVCGRGGG